MMQKCGWGTRALPLVGLTAIGAAVLPAIRTQKTAAGSTCESCHGSGLAQLSLASPNSAQVCKEVLAKLNKLDIGNNNAGVFF